MESDQLLVATGGVPNSERLNLEKTGVRTDEQRFIVTNEYMETNVEGIYALGYAGGHYQFKHSANLEAQYDFYNMMDPKRKVPVDYTGMPHVIFTSTQNCGCGQNRTAA